MKKTLWFARAALLCAALSCGSAGAEQTASAPAGDVSPHQVQSKIERTREILKDAQEDKGKAAADNEGAQDLTRTGFKMMQGLLLCLGILAIGLYAAKKLGLKPALAAGRKIRFLERTPVSARTSLLLAEIEGKRVLLAVGPDRVSLLELKDENAFGQALASAEPASVTEA